MSMQRKTINNTTADLSALEACLEFIKESSEDEVKTKLEEATKDFLWPNFWAGIQTADGYRTQKRSGLQIYFDPRTDNPAIVLLPQTNENSFGLYVMKTLTLKLGVSRKVCLIESKDERMEYYVQHGLTVVERLKNPHGEPYAYCKLA